MRLMMLEDQSLIMGALASLLALEPDIEVVCQCSSLAKAKAAWPQQVDLILADIELGDGTALDFAQWLQQQGVVVPMVLLSTFARPGYLARAKALNLGGYLLKDMPAEQLAQQLRLVLSGQQCFARPLQSLMQPNNPLSERERQVLILAEQGKSTQQIALSIHRSPGWVRNCLSSAIQKMQANNRIEAALRARDAGFL